MEGKELLPSQARYERESDGHIVTMRKLTPSQMQKVGLRNVGDRPRPSDLTAIGKMLQDKATTDAENAALKAELLALRSGVATDSKSILKSIAKAKTLQEVDKIIGDSEDLEIIDSGEKRKLEIATV